MVESEEFKAKLSSIIQQGLVKGLGFAEPGHMCIEAAIVFARGEKFSDTPSCVAAPDRAFAIRINDANWSSNQARAKALLPLALAQLNTAGTDRRKWTQALVLGTINKVLPVILEKKFSEHAKACAEAKTLEEAKKAARSAAYAAYAAAYAASAAYAAAAAEKILNLSVQVALEAYQQEALL